MSSVCVCVLCVCVLCVCVLTRVHRQNFSTGDNVQLSFHKNGRFMGVAFSLDVSVLRGCPLFPHVLCKNCSIRFLLDSAAPPWYPSPPGFTPLAVLPAGQRVRATLAPSSRTQCEVSSKPFKASTCQSGEASGLY